MGIYPRLLGSAWNELPASVQRIHVQDQPVQMEGVFRIQRGSNLVAKVLCWLLRLPRNAESAATKLSVRFQDGAETWSRDFAGKPFVTVQTAIENNRLIERVGLVDITLRLDVKNGMLTYVQERAALRFGPLRIPCPAWLAPQTFASECASEIDGLASVSVKVKAPFVGTLITYDGTLGVREPAA